VTHKKADSDVGFFVSVVCEVGVFLPFIERRSSVGKGPSGFEDCSYIYPLIPLLTCPPISRVPTMDGLDIALYFLFA